MFERSRQAENVSTRRAGGLGLSIAHHIVIAHRGRIHAYSDGPGKGARFVIELSVEIASS